MKDHEKEVAGEDLVRALAIAAGKLGLGLLLSEQKKARNVDNDGRG